MTQHQQELDRTLRITAEDRQSNQAGLLTAAQVSRARRHFALLTFFIAAFFGGSLALLVFDTQSRSSWVGVLLLGASILSGWLMWRYIHILLQVKSGFLVRSVEGTLLRSGSTWDGPRGGSRRHFTLRVGDQVFDTDRSVWGVVRDGCVYRAYFIELGKNIPPHLVALEEVDPVK